MGTAAEKSGRSRESVSLVAVTKTVAPDRIREACRLGVSLIGENRVQEALAKREATQDLPLTHHMIGHLQTNKARKAVELFGVIQSVDSPKLAASLDRISSELGRPTRCLIEVKISEEPAKTGVPMNEAEDFILRFGQYAHLRLEGLMTIAPFDAPPDDVRMRFRKFQAFFQKNRKWLSETPVLSMGMSDDFEMAIEEGSTMVRIGRALFGERT